MIMKTKQIVKEVLLIALLSVPLVETKASKLSDDFVYFDKWLLLEQKLKELTGNLVSVVQPGFVEIAREVNISTECVEEVLVVLDGMRNAKKWAMRFLDSSAKPFDGFLETSWVSLGRYDECIGLEAGATEAKSIGGQYCLLYMKPHVPSAPRHYILEEPVEELKNLSESDSVLSVMARYSNYIAYSPMMHAVCIPSGCTEHDVQSIATRVANDVGIIIERTNCQTRKKNDYSPAAITALCYFGLMGVMLFIGTLFHIFEIYKCTENSNRITQYLLAFSMISNFKKLFDVKQGPRHIAPLNGIRVISMIWIITYHSFSFRPQEVATNDILTVKNGVFSFWGQVIANFSVVIETFFFLSGFLLSYNLTLKLRDGCKIVSFPEYILVKLVRFYPAMVCATMFAFLSHLLSPEPIWEQTDLYYNSCHQLWWKNLLFINNIYRSEEMCIPHLWYVACDVQLSIPAFFLIRLLNKKNKIGVLVLTIFIMISLFYIGSITYLKGLLPVYLFQVYSDEHMTKFLKYAFCAAIVHAAPYLIGLLTGYFWATKPQFKLSKVVLSLGWLLNIAVNMTVVFGVMSWNREEEIEIGGGIIYASFYRLAWALTLAWIVVCCAAGYGGVVNYILSWSIWLPLSRFTFFTYVLHPIVQMFFFGSVHSLLPRSVHILVWVIFGDICVSYLFGLVGCLTCESPIASIVKIYVCRNNSTEPSEDGKNRNNCLDRENQKDIFTTGI